jgi:hypothetical protein
MTCRICLIEIGPWEFASKDSAHMTCVVEASVKNQEWIKAHHVKVFEKNQGLVPITDEELGLKDLINV